MSVKMRNFFLICFCLAFNVSDAGACRPDLSQSGASAASASASPSSPEIGIPLTFEMIATLNRAVGQSTARLRERLNAAMFDGAGNDITEQLGGHYEHEKNDGDGIGR